MSGMFLFELLCEEIPANALPGARRQLAENVAAKLQEAGLGAAQTKVFSTARRLVLWLEGLPPATPERVEEVLGPPVAAAFAPDGSFTRAAEGFARACGVTPEELVVVEGPKGKVVAARKRVPGKPTPEVLARILAEVVSNLHFPKTMRWGDGAHVFVRPVHALVALWGEGSLTQVVPMELFGVASGSRTWGHRVVHPGPVELLGTAGLAAYLERLRQAGVVVDPEERRKLLGEAVAALAAEVGCQVRSDPQLAEEHVELVEFPGVVRGAIEERWLALPPEVVVTTLRHHQKCLVLEREGQLAPYFFAVCDRPDDPEGHVRRGNEWVAGARLADAHFFYHKDLETPLEELARKLERITFHAKLGSFAAKAERVAKLAAALAGKLGDEALVAQVTEAALLAKADLASSMVGEFPELQGVMGGVYAKAWGKPEEVWRAIAFQYQPAGQEGPIPPTLAGAIVGVADRMDTLAALFSLGEVPTGSKDPFALRRHALSVVRICGEFPLPLALPELATWASAPFGGQVQNLAEFLRERERFFLEWRGLPSPVVEAVLSASWGVPAEDEARGRALAALWQEPAYLQLATAFKRVRNMVSKEGEGRFAPQLAQEPAERALVERVVAVEGELAALVAGRRWPEAFRLLGELAAPLDRFFTEVLVLCEDAELRQARLGILAKVQRMFLQLADLAKLQGVN